MYAYGSCLFYVCCTDCVGVSGNVCCIADVFKDSGVFVHWSVKVCCMFA